MLLMVKQIIVVVVVPDLYLVAIVDIVVQKMNSIIYMEISIAQNVLMIIFGTVIAVANISKKKKHSLMKKLMNVYA